MFPFKFSLLVAGLSSWALHSRLTFAASTDSGDVVDIGYAKYQGNRSFENTVAYLGLPYAEPPLGEMRFRAPLPLNTTRITVEAGGQVIDATEYPDFCVQGSIGQGDAGGAGTEDCLKINVYAPFGAKSGDDLPVLVYIHGGGYVFGNPANWPFDSWINQSPNVVIASVYYRLDSFGFLSIPEFNDPANGDMNAGFRDQIQALKWVKAHISSFGGDPEKVTINGQSAGGGSVELHIVAEEGEQLFSGAIAQSVARTPVALPEQEVPLFNFYTQAAGCGDASVSVTDRLACLRKASISALARAQDAAHTAAFNGSYSSFNPVVDGKIITDYPTVSILNGRFARVPLIVGATSNETGGSGTDLAASMHAIFPLLTPEDLDEFDRVYPLSEFISATQRVQVAGGESTLRCAREVLGAVFADTTKAWTYRYNQPNPTQGTNLTLHAAENWMMFNGINTGTNGTGVFTPMTPVEKAFASELIAYWLSFVRSEDPNTFKLDRSPVWTGYDTTSPQTKMRVVLQEDPNNLTTVSGIYNEMEPEVEDGRCMFVGSKAAREQN